MSYRQNPKVKATEVDGEFFLVEPQSKEIFYLNALTSGLWRLLATPQDRDQALAVLIAAFPDGDGAQIERELDQALEDFTAGGLVIKS